MDYYSLNQHLFELKKIRLETELKIFENENESKKFDDGSKKEMDLYDIRTNYRYKIERLDLEIKKLNDLIEAIGSIYWNRDKLYDADYWNKFFVGLKKVKPKVKSKDLFKCKRYIRR